MQKVSKEYTKSMKAPLRERGYLRATLNLFNEDFQKNSTATASENNLFSIPVNDILKYNPNHNEYATFEENFIKVDGKSTRFMKQDMTTATNTGWVSNSIKPNNVLSTKITITTPKSGTIKGLTLDFGDNYATEFEIETNQGKRLSVTNNNSNKWFTMEVFENVTSLSITFRRMRYYNNRLRLYGVLLGHNLVFNNENIIRSTLNEYMSPITSELPQSDFNLVADNSDHRFDIENPKSPIHYINEKTPMYIQYGYQIPNGNIEWLEPFVLYCNEWNCDDDKFNITCTDIFRNLTGIYDNGIKSVNCREAAEDIFRSAGIPSSNYILDSKLSDLMTVAIFPKVTHREALQLLANYTRCTLRQRRDGKIEISTYDKAELKFFYEVTSSRGLPECDILSIFTEEPSIEYAMFSQDYITVDGGMKFAKTGTKAMVNSGYITSNISDDLSNITADRFYIEPNPKKKFNHIRFTFAQKAIPKQIEIGYCKWSATSENWVYDKKYVLNITSEDSIIDFNLDDYKEQPTVFGMIFIKMIDTLIPNSRIILKKIEMDDATSFKMTRSDMISKPRTLVGERIGKLRVVLHHRKLAAEPSSLFKQKIDKKDTEPITICFDEPHDEYKVTVDGVVNANISSIDKSPYKITINFNKKFTGELEVTGKGFEMSDSTNTSVINPNCDKELVWDNPLVEDRGSANSIRNKLSKYYKNYISYEYDTRGNPELEVGDVITQEGKKVQIYEQTLEFNQGFKGKIKTYKLGG